MVRSNECWLSLSLSNCLLLAGAVARPPSMKIAFKTTLSQKHFGKTEDDDDVKMYFKVEMLKLIEFVWFQNATFLA